MSIVTILIGILNCAIVAAVLVLLGAIVLWVCSMFGWPIPVNIQRIYMLIVLLVFLICIVSDIAGSPMFHIIPHS